MRIAAYKTLKISKKTRRSYAYNALERDDLNSLEGANIAFSKFLNGEMKYQEELGWAARELEYRELNN